MEEARALAQHQQQLLLQHQQQQAQNHHQQQQQQQQQQSHHQNPQQFLLFQQLQQQQAAMSRFPSNIDAHLLPPGLHRPITLQQQNHNPNPHPSPNPNSNLQQQTQQNQQPLLQQQQQQLSQQQHQQKLSQQQQQQQQQLSQQQQQQQKSMRPLNQLELQMAYQDAWRVCHPDFKRPFTSLEDACERLLPYHVVADYEAEEDDRILDSDTTGQMLSRSQQWDHNIAAKVAEFTGTFEKQALAFNIITRKRAIGEFRSEERLMIEQALLQEEKRAMMELRAEIESRERAGREAHEARLRMAAMAQADQSRDEMIAHGPIRASALGGSQGSNMQIGRHDMGEQEQGVNPDEMMNGWGNNTQREEKEPSEDFLNDEEVENGDTGVQQDEWREAGEFDLNSR